jgi:fructoselysine-6-P-deglycase FrlB-like protein
VVVSFHYVYQRLNANLHVPVRQPPAAPSYMWSLVCTTCIREAIL